MEAKQESKVNDPSVQVKTLDGMICASFWGYGNEPESKGWAKLKAWAKTKGIYGNLERHPIYGFDNPRPSRYSYDNDTKDGSYGYEYLIKLDERCPVTEEMRIVEFRGGLYAVSHMPDFSQHPIIWTFLMNWPKENGYEIDQLRPWLEKHVAENEKGETKSLDLYLPIIPLKK